MRILLLSLLLFVLLFSFSCASSSSLSNFIEQVPEGRTHIILEEKGKRTYICIDKKVKVKRFSR